eukprot:739323-Prorocentrum_lima.AAC.1
MTSSLVGSEMCIRDRDASPDALGVPGRGDPVKHKKKLPALEIPPGIPPVSYTHLTLPTICSV